jgi:hypothetical protein
MQARLELMPVMRSDMETLWQEKDLHSAMILSELSGKIDLPPIKLRTPSRRLWRTVGRALAMDEWRTEQQGGRNEWTQYVLTGTNDMRRSDELRGFDHEQNRSTSAPCPRGRNDPRLYRQRTPLHHEPDQQGTTHSRSTLGANNVGRVPTMPAITSSSTCRTTPSSLPAHSASNSANMHMRRSQIRPH